MQTIKKESKNAFELIEVPSRSEKLRHRGLTMVLDKGLGLHQTHDLMEAASFIDIIKLGWGTPRLVTESTICQKVAIYSKHDIYIGNGGTLFEIAFQQRKVTSFFRYAREIGLNLIEISNGIISLSAKKKADIIHQAKDLGFLVVSEVGRKDPAEDLKIPLQERISEAHSDLRAGAAWVIIEARESGKSLGIYDEKGAIKEDMAKNLVEEIGIENIMFEAPEKSQQAYLILRFGCDVNLGNISPDDVISLETLRRGLRGDTFGKL